MTAKRKVFTFYGTIIGISLAILFLFDLNLYAKVVLCTLILLCLLIMRSVKNAMVIPPNHLESSLALPKIQGSNARRKSWPC